MSTIVQNTLRMVQAGTALTESEAEQVFAAIMAGEATHAQIGALLMGLSIRGETPEIVAGAARAMRAAATTIHPKSHRLLDTCGTGGTSGSGVHTFNISTAVAIVVAACGQPVAKHGNRAISSRSGSADVLEVLGVRLDVPPQRVADCIDEIGIGFLFAPGHHPAMKHAGPARRELGVRSVFNLLGPLTNPAGAGFQVLGVYDASKLDLVAGALARLGTERSLVVHGRDGMDEITTTGITDAILVEDGEAPCRFEIDPAAFGIPYAAPEALAGGDATENADILRHIFAGLKGAGRDIVLLNAGAALWITGKAAGIPEGIAMAAEAIDTGKAQDSLDKLVTYTNQDA